MMNIFDEAFKQQDVELSDSLETLKQNAYKKLQQIDLPTRKDEAWKYTRLNSWKDKKFNLPSELGDIDSIKADLVGFSGILLINGRFHSVVGDLDAGLSLNTGLTKPELAEIIAEDSAEDFSDLLGESFLSHIHELKVEKNARAKICVYHVVSQVRADSIHTSRLIVKLDALSELTLDERFISFDSGAYVAYNACHILQEKQSKLHHRRLQVHPNGVDFLSKLSVRLNADASYHGLQLDLGARLSRNLVNVKLQQSGSFAQLDSLVLAANQQHFDSQTCIEHLAPHTQSSQVYKSIVGDSATNVFSGQIKIAKGANQSNAHQLNKNLLLSNHSQANSKPQLLIDTDDVKCSHGSTTGQLDSDELFYLRSRGIDSTLAKHLLTKAFARDVLMSHTQFESVDDFLEEKWALLHE